MLDEVKPSETVYILDLERKKLYIKRIHEI